MAYAGVNHCDLRLASFLPGEPNWNILENSDRDAA